jgi:hypothetical protein
MKSVNKTSESFQECFSRKTERCFQRVFGDSLFLVFYCRYFSGTVVGENDLSEIFAQRPRLNARITELIDAATGPWGIEVSQAGAFDQARSGSMF